MTDLPDLKLKVIPAMPSSATALVMLAFQQENRLRVLEGAPPLTLEQFKQMANL